MYSQTVNQPRPAHDSGDGLQHRAETPSAPAWPSARPQRHPAGTLRARVVVLDRLLVQLFHELPTVEEIGDLSITHNDREAQLVAYVRRIA
jgi:hypothetical protein